MPPVSDTPPIIVWFRQDLRVADHPALLAAAAAAPVIPLFILDDENADGWKPGGASRWWLHGSLAALDADLRARGSRLILRHGKAPQILDQVISETGAAGVFLTRRYEPYQAAQDQVIADTLANRGITCRRFGGSLLFEPEAVQTKSGGPFRVFTPFYKACLALDMVMDPMPAPDTIPAPSCWPHSDGLGDWGLRPTVPDWSAGLRDRWQPGSGGAENHLNRFLRNGLSDYGVNRDRPDREGTSSLSPHLHFGDISPRQIWDRVQSFASEPGATVPGCSAYLRELVWREFSYHLLHHWPSIPEQPFNAKFGSFPWRHDQDALMAWQQGRTGYPIVDAGMRQLWHTGWMHNRVRMIAASFLTKHLLIPWQEGARWFWDTLVDADLASNSASWQWVAGCGADAAPYFRIFNPVLQGRKFDPDGSYVRRWLPELSEFPDRYVHAPWEAEAYPNGYPMPLIDHKHARQRALEAYQTVRAAN